MPVDEDGGEVLQRVEGLAVPADQQAEVVAGDVGHDGLAGSRDFDFDLEAIATARARGLAVGESPIPTHYGDEISHLNPLTYGLRVLRVLWRFQRGTYGV